MSDYFSRSELSRIERGASLAPSAVSAIAPVQSAAQPARQDGRSPDKDAPDTDGQAERRIASSAEYARVHARIADIMADLGRQGSGRTVAASADEIQSMLPAPQVLVPLPPASREAVESTIRIARRIAEQAALAQSAQAHVSRGLVDQIVNAGA